MSPNFADLYACHALECIRLGVHPLPPDELVALLAALLTGP